MSTLYNKKSPTDFGLTYRNGVYLRESDNSEWKPCFLYDSGYGREVGFYKVPFPSFFELIDIIENYQNSEDVYGALSVFIFYDYYMDRLFYYIKSLKNEDKHIFIKKTNKFFHFTNLSTYILKSSTLGKIEWELLLKDFIVQKHNKKIII